MDIQLARIPRPSVLRRSIIDQKYHFWSGFYCGLQVNYQCAECERSDRIPEPHVIEPAIVPKGRHLKWLPKDLQSYWRGYHSARRSGLCFECIREDPDAVPTLSAMDYRRLGLSLGAIAELKQRLDRERCEKTPERRPRERFERFESCFPEVPTSEVLKMWNQYVITCPVY